MVSSLNNINFTSVAYTKNGNEYKKSDIGKYVGAGIGVAGAAGALYFAKNFQKSNTAKRLYIVGMNKAVDFLTKHFNVYKEAVENISRKEFRAIRSTSLKNNLKYGAPVVAVIALLSGLADGAVVDKIINKFRAKKADKAELV